MHFGIPGRCGRAYNQVGVADSQQGERMATAKPGPSQTVEAERPLGADVEEVLRRLLALIEGDKVEEARALVAYATQSNPDSLALRRWARLLRPPEATLSIRKRFRDTRPEREWLNTHRHDYPGCWLAVANGRLVAADPDLERVQEAIRDAVGDDGAVICYQGVDVG